MSLAEAVSLLEEAPANADLNHFASALALISRHISTRTIDSQVYSSIICSLLDKVAPRLASAALEQYETMSEHFDNIFLNSYAPLAFKELCAVLNQKEERSEVVARTLILFVDPSFGGVERIRSVLASSELQNLLSPLIHLPSRITSALYSDSKEASSDTPVLNEDQYYSTIAEAIMLQPSTSDPYRDHALSELLERLVRLKLSDIIVSKWLDSGSENQVVVAMIRAPQNCIDRLVRSLLSTEATSFERATKITNALSKVIKESRTACDSCINKIPFQRPLFKKPRTALKRLIKSLEFAGGKKVLLKALNRTAHLWSSEQLSKYADIQLQRQVTRLLLYYMRYTSKFVEAGEQYSDKSVMFILVDGVHFRLAANDARVQRLGMVVGEASSRYSKDENPLTFERHEMTEARMKDATITGDDRFEDGGDSDFSDLATEVTTEFSDDEHGASGNQNSNGNNNLSEGSEIDSARKSANGNGAGEHHNLNGFHNSNSLPKRQRKRDVNVWSLGSSVTQMETVEDDWTSVDSYELSDDCSENLGNGLFLGRSVNSDYNAVRKKISAPFSVPRLLGLLREVNQSDGGALRVNADTATAALRTLAARAEALFGSKGTTLHACAIELCLEVVHIDPDRYPDEFMPAMIEAKQMALQRLLEMDIVECGIALVERVICGPSADIGRRSECLGALSASVRGAEERAIKQAREKVKREEQAATERAKTQSSQRVGTIVRQSNASKRATSTGSGHIIRTWDDDGLGRMFDALAFGLCKGGGADFVDVDSRDNQLWAQGIITLGVIGCIAGASEEGRRMRGDVLEIAIDRVLGESDADAVVRRGCALAMGAVGEAMTEAEIEGRIISGLASENSIGMMLGEPERDQRQIVRRAAEWLQAATGDSDVGVRRFAMRALSIWADRVQ